MSEECDHEFGFSMFCKKCKKSAVQIDSEIWLTLKEEREQKE